MRNLKPLTQMMKEAEQNGEDPSYMLVDPEDVCSVNPEELEPDDED